MKIPAILLVLCSLSSGIQAQEYKLSTTQHDVFSRSLVKLLNCAANDFADCSGKIIRSTSLMGDDRQLTISFPGSAAAVVRGRDWVKNAYIEFRGYPDKQSSRNGLYDIVAKIKKALGNQLYDPNESEQKNYIYFYGLSVKDKNGYFAMNMELFCGSSSAPIYLLGPEFEDKSKPSQEFVLLKIYSCVPSYQHYIRSIAPPDNKTDATIRQLVLAAEKDFDSLQFETKKTILAKPKKIDTLRINGADVIMNYRRANHSATLSFPIKGDSVQFNTQWNGLQRSLQAALGSEYVYQVNERQDESYIIYFSGGYIEKKPRIYLETGMEDRQHPVINIRIESSYTHETNRGLSADDF